MIVTYAGKIYPKTQEYTEDGYCVCRYISWEKKVDNGELTNTCTDDVVASGYYLPQTRRAEFDFDGEWTEGKYGKQFKVKSYKEVIVQTKDGIRSYLSSGLIKGIGPKTAEKIVDRFGTEALEVIEKDPDKLLEIKGITRKKLDGIIQGYLESRAMQIVLQLLAPFGVSTKTAMKIYKEFGNDSANIIKTDTFRLCKIPGLGFKTVDVIARNSGLSPSDPKRIKAAILYTLNECGKHGHMFLPRKQFWSNLSELLTYKGEMAFSEINKDLLREVVEEMLDAREIIVYDKEPYGNGNQIVYSAKAYEAELFTADDINKLIKNGPKSVIENYDIDEMLKEAGVDIELADKQKEAVEMCLECPVSILTGGPGVGKTTSLNAILKVYDKFCHGRVALMAPTGRAASRMSESTGHYASTIHKALMITSNEDDDNDVSSFVEGLDADFVVVDEFSMVDMYLANVLFKSIKEGTRVLLVGDPDQLPSVGPGNVFRELISSKRIPVTTLDVIFRQDETSPIVTNAYRINHGETNLEFADDFKMLEVPNAEVASDFITAEYMKAVGNEGFDNVQILTPFRSRGDASVDALNSRIRDIINPQSVNRAQQMVGKRMFREGDRVMQMKNRSDYCLNNGDIGTLAKIQTVVDDEGFTTTKYLFDFGKDQLFEYTTDDLKDVDLAYATTVHKSQGSEFHTVIIAMLNEFSIMLKRNLLYTAVTRAKKKVVIIGNKTAVNTAVRRNDIEKRNTRFGEMIVQIA